jgi:hypothetical protein
MQRAVLAYLGSLILIRYKLRDTQAVAGSSGSTVMYDLCHVCEFSADEQ